MTPKSIINQKCPFCDEKAKKRHELYLEVLYNPRGYAERIHKELLKNLKRVE